MNLLPPVNLKKKYNATWALVTGGGSGIGRSLAFAIAKQGLNVCVVSLDDDFLKTTMKDLRASFPDLEFRSVATSFNPGMSKKDDYLTKIDAATKDICVQVRE